MWYLCIRTLAVDGVFATAVAWAPAAPVEVHLGSREEPGKPVQRHPVRQVDHHQEGGTPIVVGISDQPGSIANIANGAEGIREVMESALIMMYGYEIL